jgi:hypothetical protein
MLPGAEPAKREGSQCPATLAPEGKRRERIYMVIILEKGSRVCRIGVKEP